MEEGDSFAKKFGGDQGTDPDWFLLTAEGVDEKGDLISTTSFYLADFRFKDDTKDYIVKDWQWFDLTSLGEVAKVRFKVTSSDVGGYGMNTPAYFCIDNIDEPRLQYVGNYEVVELNGLSTEIDLETWFNDLNGSPITTRVISMPKGTNASIEDNLLTLQRDVKGAVNGQLVIMAVCEKMSKMVTIDIKSEVASDVSDFVTKKSLTLYPNPASHMITVEGILSIESHSYKIVDIQGAVVKQGALDSNNQIDIQNLISGVYFIVLDQEKEYLKFMKK
ncbi:DUF4465 domain-containing protein [Halosquirtibacter xylanolyticus]|uniref:DUF4465 domain-containing protein n=1 Tax=Halosquirtibacter xylanolyticus TaxID=3374599 RepID=UPI003748F23B|nr:DUF4465 domain-containing protein [Prolixibacteraceae bacterium]